MDNSQIKALLLVVYMAVFILPILYTSWYVAVNGYTGYLRKLKIDNLEDTIFILVMPLMVWPAAVACYVFYLVMCIPYYLTKKYKKYNKTREKPITRREYVDD